MSEVLSQSEIDTLLNALTSGDFDVSDVPAQEEKGKTIRDHDFARPSKFGKEQLRTLENIFDNYARLVSTFMTGYLRASTQIEVMSSEQVTYGEFNNSLSNPMILSIVNVSPLKGSIVLDLSPNIGYSIIDRVLGGEGSGVEKIRDFSEIEKILLERMLNQLLGYLVEPFENIIHLSPQLEKIETNPQFAQIISPNEMVALVTLNIQLGEMAGLMNFCIPHLVIEPIMDRLNTKHWFSQTEEEDTGEYRNLLEKKLDTAQIPVKTLLGKTSITVEEFINLQVGDIIPLDSYINSDIDIMVGDLLKFRGKPGVNKGKNAIQITNVIRKEET